MGSHDVLRLVKGLRIEAGLEEALRDGLRERLAELEADLATLKGIRGLLAARGVGDPGALQPLDESIRQWDEFCELLRGPWSADAETIHQMLRFAAIRSMALRAVSAHPGAQAALSTLAKPGSSFVFRGRKLAPPRCLFHSMARGCLAGRWKPGKCANFFCSGDPNVLSELRATLSFDEFVLANFVVASPAEILRAVEAELALGPEYHEPKVLLCLGDAAPELRGLLKRHFSRLVEPDVPPEYMVSSNELEVQLSQLGPGEALVVACRSVGGAALYELAIALDQHRARGEAVAFYLLADGYSGAGALPHPLWGDSEMSQPLGVLDLYLCDASAG